MCLSLSVTRVVLKSCALVPNLFLPYNLQRIDEHTSFKRWSTTNHFMIIWYWHVLYFSLPLRMHCVTSRRSYMRASLRSLRKSYSNMDTSTCTDSDRPYKWGKKPFWSLKNSFPTEVTSVGVSNIDIWKNHWIWKKPKSWNFKTIHGFLFWGIDILQQFFPATRIFQHISAWVMEKWKLSLEESMEKSWNFILVLVFRWKPCSCLQFLKSYPRHQWQYYM